MPIASEQAARGFGCGPAASGWFLPGPECFGRSTLRGRLPRREALATEFGLRSQGGDENGDVRPTLRTGGRPAAPAERLLPAQLRQGGPPDGRRSPWPSGPPPAARAALLPTRRRPTAPVVHRAHHIRPKAGRPERRMPRARRSSPTGPLDSSIGLVCPV